MAGTALSVRWCTWLAAVGFVSTLVGAQASQEPATSPTVTGVRTSSPKLAALIAEGTERSATFRAIVASIEATDGIVFVEEGVCRFRVPACLTWQVTIAGPYRILFILIDRRRSGIQAIASTGHELRHALEVLANPALRSTAAMYSFYLTGPSPESPRAIETRAAETAERAVLLEVRQSQAAEKK